MTHPLLQKTAALACAALMTAVTLGLVELMAVGQHAAMQMARDAAPATPAQADATTGLPRT